MVFCLYISYMHCFDTSRCTIFLINCKIRKFSPPAPSQLLSIYFALPHSYIERKKVSIPICIYPHRMHLVQT